MDNHFWKDKTPPGEEEIKVFEKTRTSLLRVTIKKHTILGLTWSYIVIFRPGRVPSEHDIHDVIENFARYPVVRIYKEPCVEGGEVELWCCESPDILSNWTNFFRRQEDVRGK